MAASAADPADYGSELRFGVVMYGGVSLAIYINGVSHELFEMACATPRVPAADDAATDDGAATREIYRRLSLLAEDAGRVARYAQALKGRGQGREDVWPAEPASEAAPRPTRFIVDVIAGTSAGGINGIYLAKALVNGEDFSPLARLWTQEGDIGRLLNDQRHDGQAPASLLDSDRMYLQLLGALDAMPPLRGFVRRGEASPLVEELDLYVTTTDIVGAPVPLRLFDQVVLERRHKQRFHFSYPSRVALPGQPPGQDFAPDNHAFLAFAARCTSSFPFAFEPMTLARTQALARGVDAQRLAGWRPYFDALPAAALADDAHLNRPFGDGGYLDNKPFSYVVEALSQRFGDVPARRKLLYVEPDPERLENVDPRQAPTPNAIEHTLDALVGIPLYETIREDLQVILQRNRRIERVERIVRLGEQDVERILRRDGRSRFERVRLDKHGHVPAWQTLWLERMVGYYGEAYLPYQRLRVYATSDWQAEQMAGVWGVDPASDGFYALRALARHWRERYFADTRLEERERLRRLKAQAVVHPADWPARLPVNAFLDRYDLDYRLRRLGFLLRRIDIFTQRLDAGAVAPTDALGELLAQKFGRYFDPDRDDLGAWLRQADVCNALRPALADLKARLRATYDAVLRLRRERARGGALAQALQLDPDLRAEMAQLLRALLGQAVAPPGGAAVLVLSGVKPGLAGAVPQPAEALKFTVPPPWALTPTSALDLQDIVLQRVRHFESQWPPDREARVWQVFKLGLEATQVNAPTLYDDGLDLRLHDCWTQLHEPQLVAVLRRNGRSKVAELQVKLRTCEPGSAQALEVRTDNALRQMFGEYFLTFDGYDQMRYPLYYDTDTGEPAIVDVVRVSPLDATALRGPHSALPKLAGTALAHFGAFLDERWRRNDIMWGRLDGVERLVRTALPGRDDDSQRVAAELVRLAQGRILQAELVRPARAQLTGLLAQAVAEVAGRGGRPDRLSLLLDDLDIGHTPARQALAGALEGLLDHEQLVWYVSTRPTFDAQPRPEDTLRNAARAVAIAGRMLEAISKSHDQAAAGTATRWLARLGLLLQGVVALSVPRSLGQRWRSDALRLLYGFEVLLLVLAWLTGGAELRWAALSALTVTAALHLLVLVAGDYAVGRNRWWRRAAVLAGCGVVAAALVGGVATWHWGRDVLCVPAAVLLQDRLQALRTWACPAPAPGAAPAAAPAAAPPRP